MKTIEWFDETPFVNEECGDTMWNEENLNPPKGNESKVTLPEPVLIETEKVLRPSESSKNTL